MMLHNLSNNMVEVETEKFTVLFSYNTPVACKSKVDSKAFKTSRKWSVTTSKHVSKWLNGLEAEPMEQGFFDSLV